MFTPHGMGTVKPGGSLTTRLASNPDVRNPGGLAAAIERRIKQHGMASK